MPVVLLVLLAVVFLWARATYDRIERVDLDGVLDPVAGDATNYLLVGSDSRDQLDPEQNSGVEGRRADTIIVLRVDPSGARMMSIPRDLWVELDGTDEMGRINGAYNNGPAALVRTVQKNLDIPVNHYMEVGFASFVGLVDAIGGVSIDFEHAARDEASGLYIDSPGTHVLDGQQALAYARSREYTEVIDGRDVREPTADLGRQQRQQLFLRSALAEVGATRNPIALARVANAMSDELIVDSGLGMGEAFSLVRKLGSAEMETVVLPTVGVRRGRAAVLELDEPAAQTVLDGFR